MATETASIPVNGTHPPHHGYGGIETQNNYSYSSNSSTTAVTTPASSQPPPGSSTPAAASAASQSDIPKDEVGWYFVEQYYTTLSRSPEKLYLFYNKRSQFVSGQETDKVPVCVGQRAINERIKEQDFQDCKVRVTNVDSQASDSNIVIQVIGEISNKSQPHKKFTQTFVLATQTNGYFVLNDIFRYLLDDEEDGPEPEVEAEQSAEEVPLAASSDVGQREAPPSIALNEPKTLTSSADPVAVERDAELVDREIEDKLLAGEPSPVAEPVEPLANGVAAETTLTPSEETAPPTVDALAKAATPEPPATVLAAEPEEPPAPEPTPSPPPKQAAPPPAPAAPKPSAPKTWASMAASANRTVATPAQVAAPASSQSRPTPPGTKTSTSPAPPASAAPPPVMPAAAAPVVPQRDESPTGGSQGSEWTAVGGNHNRQQSRQTNYQQQEAGPITRAYIKNVPESVDRNDLRAHLEQYGELAFFDIQQQRNSALIEFKTPEGYLAAVAANPHVLNGERIYVEERKQFGARGGFQGGRGGRGRGDQGQQRGGYTGGGRGGYQPRGRGVNTSGSTRGRGGPPGATQAA